MSLRVFSKWRHMWENEDETRLSGLKLDDSKNRTTGWFNMFARFSISHVYPYFRQYHHGNVYL